MALRGFWAGTLWGVGLALFLVYVLTDDALVGLTPSRPQRLAVGGLGLALWVPGLRLERATDHSRSRQDPQDALRVRLRDRAGNAAWDSAANSHRRTCSATVLSRASSMRSW